MKALAGLPADATAAQIRAALQGKPAPTTPTPSRRVVTKVATPALRPGEILHRDDLAEANPFKYDRVEEGLAWAAHGVTPFPLSNDRRRYGIAVDRGLAFGQMPWVSDVTHHAYRQLLLGSHEGHFTSEDKVRDYLLPGGDIPAELFATRTGFGPNCHHDFPKGLVTVPRYLPHINGGPARLRCVPDLVWTDAAAGQAPSTVVVGELKFAATHRSETFSHRQVYLPYLVAKKRWPHAVVHAVVALYRNLNEVYLAQVVYPDDDIVDARLGKVVQLHFRPSDT